MVLLMSFAMAEAMRENSDFEEGSFEEGRMRRWVTSGVAALARMDWMQALNSFVRSCTGMSM